MEIITDNTQLTIFGGFAPNSQSAEVLSKALGEQTVQSGSVSCGKEKSQSLQMIGRPLLTVDELKSMPKGQCIVMKTGTHPMISPLKLYFKWGIKFGEEYRLPDKTARAVSYKERDELIKDIEIKYPQKAGSPRGQFCAQDEEEFEELSAPQKMKIRTGADKNRFGQEEFTIWDSHTRRSQCTAILPIVRIKTANVFLQYAG